ncbi:MAG: acetyl/propionyl/methylcrotonyl-CoA carboxylase subunit alpha [Desulfuromonadaceae bacterium]|nr:acetyl/propionyl/methylcrotonyl-CoA carboxylase subunit alpha [Desulfuromonadaceae bacterium]MDD5107789.1 acetyl/propionyl/methylcrotonyl-CoA carboxylase subunit alpha [Desulfuromonadaceae bacterium]
MFDTILIANRGEIACRVIRTAKRLGIRTVAIYSDADSAALHVSLADEAHHIGPAPARESYLIGERILATALECGAQAIHPGYGFLSENAGFAEACAAAGIVFIGPPTEAIRAMGSKSAAKEIMAGAGVPLVPGYHGQEQDAGLLQREADLIGYPLLIKASAGGGGKGMRVVERSADFAEALAGARREAMSGFGDDHVLLERYLTRPRHIEIQVFADSHGNVLHIFERDCSIQRRHQKVIEEAPAFGMTRELRSTMGGAAVAAAKAIGYVGAGTVEFLLDTDGSFYFMEMNTRLQVEHPVTEMISGLDLVEWQLRVAAGEALPLSQDQFAINGHAIEARIYAEDPARDFLPSIGTLRYLRTPLETTHVRIDSGVCQGDDVSIHYDPMIAKLIVWDCDRSSAVRRMKTALTDFHVAGVTTNTGFLGSVVSHPAFAAGEIDTGFIERNRAGLFPETAPASDRTLALAALDLMLSRTAEAACRAEQSLDPYSPWHQSAGWRLNCDNYHRLHFIDGESVVTVTAHYRPGGYQLDLHGRTMMVRGERDASGALLADLDGRRITATVVRADAMLTVLDQGKSHQLGIHNPHAVSELDEAAAGRLTAPMPGKVVAVMVEVGAQVERGVPLLIMEAMKMEHTICAPCDGVVAELYYPVGATVNEGAELLAITADVQQATQ